MSGIRTRATQKSSQFVVHKSEISEHFADNNHLIKDKTKTEFGSFFVKFVPVIT